MCSFNYVWRTVNVIFGRAYKINSNVIAVELCKVCAIMKKLISSKKVALSPILGHLVALYLFL